MNTREFTGEFTAKVLNVANYALDKEFIIARSVSGALWFYGATDDAYRAHKIAVEVDGVVLVNKG